MVKLLLWCVLFVLSWPVAILALVLYPVVWLVALPFRLLGRTVRVLVETALDLVLLPIRLPLRLLRAV
jgi:hypothetical protein